MYRMNAHEALKNTYVKKRKRTPVQLLLSALRKARKHYHSPVGQGWLPHWMLSVRLRRTRGLLHRVCCDKIASRLSRD